MPDKIIFFDLETTGLNWYHDSIIEICGYDFDIDNNKLNRKFSNLCLNKKKETIISEKISRITGITNDMLSNVPSEEKVLKRFIYFINNISDPVYLIAHNCENFDKWFLLSRCRYYSIRFPSKIKFIDSIHLAKMMYPQRDSYSLKNLCRDFKITQKSAHRADIDTICLKDVFIKMYHNYTNKYKIKNDNSIMFHIWNKLNCNL